MHHAHLSLHDWITILRLTLALVFPFVLLLYRLLRRLLLGPKHTFPKKFIIARTTKAGTVYFDGSKEGWIWTFKRSHAHQFDTFFSAATYLSEHLREPYDGHLLILPSH